MNPSAIIGHSIALLLVAENNAGKPECMLVFGRIAGEGPDLWVDLGKDRTSLPLDQDYLERIEPVTSEIKDIMCGAEYMLKLFVGNLPEDADTSEYMPLGIRWKSGST